MRLWLSKNSEVPLKEQLVAQIVLGVVSGDLKAGQKLPSTRELARRFCVHASTVSAAYRELEGRGWLEFRKGSGVYVREQTADAPADPQSSLDQLISAFLRLARERGYSLTEVQRRVKHWLSLEPPDHFLVVEPDPELRAILVAEIGDAVEFDVRGASPEEIERQGLPAGAAAVAQYGQADRARAALPPGTNLLVLHTRSVPVSLTGEERPPADALVTVVSRWEDFLRWSRNVLVAAGLDPAALIFRDARDDDWRRGISSSAMIITDTLTARELPPDAPAPRVFRVVADSSLTELRAFVEDFLTK